MLLVYQPEREREKFLIPSVFPQISGGQAHTELKWQLLYYSGRGDKGIGYGGRGKFIGKKGPGQVKLQR